MENIRHTSEYFDMYWIFIQNPIPWDLVFFSKNWIYPSHIWFYTWNDKFIHAPWKNNTKVKESKLEKKTIEHLPRNWNPLYIENPIWFKRITLEIKNFKNDRYKKII